jgi:hypothetical protein
MKAMIWVDSSNSDLVKNNFGKANTTIMTILNSTNLPVVSEEGVVNIYDMLYKEHYKLMDKAELSLEWTNGEGQAPKD